MKKVDLCEALRQVKPYREFYDGLIKDALNGFIEACDIQLDSIESIETKNYDENNEHGGVKFHVNLRSQSDDWIDIFLRKSPVGSEYIINGTSEDFRFSLRVDFSFRGTHMEGFNINLCKRIFDEIDLQYRIYADDKTANYHIFANPLDQVLSNEIYCYHAGDIVDARTCYMNDVLRIPREFVSSPERVYQEITGEKGNEKTIGKKPGSR